LISQASGLVVPDTLFDSSQAQRLQHQPVYAAFVCRLTRIIHQPENVAKEGALESWIMLKATASQAHYAPKTSASGCAEPVQIGVMVAIRHNAPW
jgi:hypothetical protein